MKKTWLVVFLLVLVMLTGCGQGAAVQAIPAALTVKILDVGQGDAILIRDGQVVTLIDTGDIPARDKLVSLLKEQNITVIDNVIITHPHADHLGGMSAILENFTIKHIYDSGQATTTSVYRNYLATVKKKNIPFTVVAPGTDIRLEQGILKVLAPQQPYITGTDSDLNNNSIVMKLQYGNFTMLLTGDAEQQEEAQLVAKYGNELASSVLKSGHHGSRTASSNTFLKAVNPQSVVISLGANNDYHHPHPSTLKKYQDLKLSLYRTDQNGTVTITSDGQKYDITKER